MATVKHTPDSELHSTEHSPPMGLTRFGDVLRRHREGRALTQDRAAAGMNVSRATFTQWELGKHLPAEQRVLQLDLMLEAGGELVAAAAEVRSAGPRTRPVDISGGTRSLMRVLQETRQAFLKQIYRDSEGRPLGWRHNLVESPERATMVSTIYGLKVLALLGGPDAGTAPVVERVMRAGLAEGRITGWAASTQFAPRLEATGAAFDALLRAGVLLDVDEIIRVIDDLLDDTARERPLILAMGLEPLLRIAPDSLLAADMVRALLDSRRDFGGVLLWPEKSLHRDQPLVGASVAHTARAITILRDAPGELVGDAVVVAEEWLARQSNIDGVTEIIRRSFSEGSREEITLHHFTSAWVVRALAGAAVPDRTAITRALEVVWKRYDPQHHLWAWGNGDVPVWMLADALAAVQEAAFALSATPIPVDLGSD